MGVTTLWLTEVETSARADRGILTDLFSEGVKNVQGNHFKVIPRGGGANMTVTVRKGDQGNAVAYVTGDDFVGQGLYRSEMDADWTDLSIAAAPATGTRTDLVVWETIDKSAVGGTVNESHPRVLTGVAALNDTHKTMIPLASIAVAAGQGSVTSANITDLRTQATAATLRIGTAALAVASSALPIGGVPGALYWATDTNSLLVDNGTSLAPVTATGFGSGADGDVVVTGTTTLSRDMNYRTLRVAAGGVLVTKGFTVRAARTVIVDAGGVVHDDGGNGYPGSTTQIGAGGSGGGGGGTGDVGQLGYSQNNWPHGGGGGGGGGVVCIVTPTLVNNGTIRANGGNAADYAATNNPAPPTQNGPNPAGRFSGNPTAAVGTVDYVGGFGGGGNTYARTPQATLQSISAGLPQTLRVVGGGGGRGSGGGQYYAGGGGGGGLIITATARRSGSGVYQVAPGANSYGLTPVSPPSTDGSVVNLVVA